MSLCDNTFPAQTSVPEGFLGLRAAAVHCDIRNEPHEDHSPRGVKGVWPCQDFPILSSPLHY